MLSTVPRWVQVKKVAEVNRARILHAQTGASSAKAKHTAPVPRHSGLSWVTAPHPTPARRADGHLSLVRRRTGACACACAAPSGSPIGRSLPWLSFARPPHSRAGPASASGSAVSIAQTLPAATCQVPFARTGHLSLGDSHISSRWPRHLGYWS